MTRYRKLPVEIEATQWFKNGDHPKDEIEMIALDGRHEPFPSEGNVVRYYRHPSDAGTRHCEHCKRTMHVHGWIDTLEGGHIVCPGDWIITGVSGETYPCKPGIFAKTYEAVDKPEALVRAMADAMLKGTGAVRIEYVEDFMMVDGLDPGCGRRGGICHCQQAGECAHAEGATNA